MIVSTTADAAAGVPPVHDNLGAVPTQFFGRCLADARSGPGNEGADALEVSLFVHLLSLRLPTSTMGSAGPAWVYEA